MPFYFGHIPQLSWIYGNLDYSFNKYHRHYQVHDDWLPDRKGKTLGQKNGSMCNPNMKNSKFMALQPQTIPKGCECVWLETWVRDQGYFRSNKVS